ncbi:alpha/beta fold hydrolase [Actinoplanes sp. NPDC051633]|uniref:alpha/beta hydrolase n=1 Tax=Actinoplanes sp. NPDC051633 TaxID=3155670 RepID=UPI0034345FE1
MRRAFAVLNRAAPGVAARWAEKLWFTLPKRAVPPPPTGDLFTVDVGGRAVVGQTWGTGPNVYLVHGWAGHAGQLSAYVAPLVERGHRVITFDALSHGRSAPGAYGRRSTSIPELALSFTAVATAYGPAHAVIAHSMGGAATALAIRDGLTAGRIATK